ncbi:hypothetical protein BDV25DRAFT_140310 [Aspergillus avenaceus]|uniref:Uncharacterized protein n=1 Tax=Aspergillus avenaceus TaxID=36643 RepID=A0A5N6TUF3_ASPAV|nr:hypothetical protein BDV25DRAFT_140310 [Aspergillus avenaceus]
MPRRKKQGKKIQQKLHDPPTLSDLDIRVLICIDYQVYHLKCKDKEANLLAIVQCLKSKCSIDLSVEEVRLKLAELQATLIPKTHKRSIYTEGTKCLSKRRIPQSYRQHIEAVRAEVMGGDPESLSDCSQELAAEDTARRSMSTDKPAQMVCMFTHECNLTNSEQPHKNVLPSLSVEIPKQTQEAFSLDTDGSLSSPPPSPNAELISQLQQLRSELSTMLQTVRKVEDAEHNAFSQTRSLIDRLLKSRLDIEQIVVQQQETDALNTSLFHHGQRLEAQCAKWDLKNRSLKFALEENKVPSALYQQEREIRWLKASLEQAKRDLKFSRLSRHHNLRPEKSFIENQMSLIDHKSKKTLCTYNDYYTLRMPDFDDHPDLRALLYRSFGFAPNHSVDQQDLHAYLARVGLQAVLCAVTAAAVCDWVFASDFESTISGRSLMLDIYRQHISRADGDDGDITLRNIDLAANDTLFKTDYYKKQVIPHRANTLAHLLSNTLAPLVPSAPETPAAHEFNTWNEDEHTWHLREYNFKEIFTIALDMKTALLTSTDQFELILYQHGSPYSEEDMVPETSSGAPFFGSYTGRIQLCLLPAVYAYSARRPGPVQYRVPVSWERKESDRMYLLSRAIVIPSLE